ncbi:MAG: Mur ligase [Microlunatus sp.]|nr:Mur ligase [Microlunatus sp.]
MGGSTSRSLVEVRLLGGPNLYFPRPAVKVTLDITSLLVLDLAAAQRFASQVGMSRSRPGPTGSAFRQRFAARAVAHLLRRLAVAGGVKRLAVRSRPGTAVSELIVAYPWRNSARAEVLADGLTAVLDALGEDPTADFATLLQRAADRLAATPPGSPPDLIRPSIPVVAVTGTNGKTTTSRMLGFVAQRAGLSVGWSSTDGVYLNGDLVEAGDYSGPSGAGQVLQQPGVQLAVTETARGGILRRGVGVAWNDVSVVTNISADHLGVGGIETLDQLAEVKAVITKITKPGGWCVLNADDPRTFAMRSATKAKVWVFTIDPNSPNGRAVIDAGGRVTTVIDSWVCVLQRGRDPLPVVPVVDVGMTLAGLSRVNVENTLAVTSAALAIGLSVDQVAAGLREFDPGENNPGRMNVWTLPVTGGQASVVIDLAHNEAGLQALIEIAQGIRSPDGRLLIGVGTAGDRTDDIFVTLGELAALAGDVVEIAHKDSYLRGRPMAELGALIRQGAENAGVTIDREHAGEVAALTSLAAQARAGDVVALMTHQDRQQVDDWLIEHGGRRDTVDDLRAKVAAAGDRR